MIPSPQRSLSWSLLCEGVPITLLCDLLYVDGPPSRQILAAEAVEDDVRLSQPQTPHGCAAHPAGGSIEPPEVTISTG